MTISLTEMNLPSPTDSTNRMNRQTGEVRTLRIGTDLCLLNLLPTAATWRAAPLSEGAPVKSMQSKHAGVVITTVSGAKLRCLHTPPSMYVRYRTYGGEPMTVLWLEPATQGTDRPFVWASAPGQVFTLASSVHRDFQSATGFQKHEPSQPTRTRRSSSFCADAIVPCIVLQLAKTELFHQRRDVNAKAAA